MDDKNKNNRVSIFLGFDLFARVGKVYVLVQSGEEIGLITINVEER